jgi:hypothetical protein
VHVTGTPIWCDARRRRDVCFVSSADRVGKSEHGQLIGTPETIALLGGGAGHLAVPLRRPFTLGTLRLELIASGRGLGAAALLVDLGARRVLYAGEIRTAGVAEKAEVRACDALVVAAPRIEPRERLRPLVEAAAELAAAARASIARRRRLHVVVDSILDGFEVAAQLAAAGIAVTAARSLRIPGAPPLATPGREPSAVVRLASDRYPSIMRDEGSVLVSLRALEMPRKFPAAIAWPFAADRDQLIAWIEHTGAREIFVTGACAESIAGALGPRARVLGPPQQMQLFEAVR